MHAENQLHVFAGLNFFFFLSPTVTLEAGTKIGKFAIVRLVAQGSMATSVKVADFAAPTEDVETLPAGLWVLVSLPAANSIAAARTNATEAIIGPWLMLPLTGTSPGTLLYVP